MSFTSLVGQPLPLSCEGLACQTSLLHNFSDFIEVYDFSDGFTEQSTQWLGLKLVHNMTL